MTGRMKNGWLSWVRILLLAVLLISLLPMLRIDFYNHSSVDDFRNGAATRQVWEETGSGFAVLQKALEQTGSYYQLWQGSYTALLLFAVQPAIFGEGFYCISFFVLMGVYLLAVFSSLRRLWRAFLPQGDKRAADILAALYCLMTIQLMPCPVEAFYVWNASVYYSFFHALSLIQGTNLLILCRRGGRSRGSAGLFAGSLVLAAVISGSNFSTTLTMLEFLALLLCWLFLRKSPVRWRALWISLVALIGFAINMAAPGNYARLADLPSAPPLWAIAQGFVEGWNQALEWTGLPLLAFYAALFVLLWLAPTTDIFQKGWALPALTGASLLIYVSAFVPTLYALSWKGPGRVMNLCFLFWTMSCILAMLSLQDGLRRLARRRQASTALRTLRQWRPRLAVPCLALCALLLCADGFVSFRSGNRTRYASLSAVDSLLSGDAAAYDMVIQDRLEILASEEPNPRLPDFWQKVPPLIFFDDITENPSDWRNFEMARYYRKETVAKVHDP